MSRYASSPRLEQPRTLVQPAPCPSSARREMSDSPRWYDSSVQLEEFQPSRSRSSSPKRSAVIPWIREGPAPVPARTLRPRLESLRQFEDHAGAPAQRSALVQAPQQAFSASSAAVTAPSRGTATWLGSLMRDEVAPVPARSLSPRLESPQQFEDHARAPQACQQGFAASAAAVRAPSTRGAPTWSPEQTSEFSFGNRDARANARWHQPEFATRSAGCTCDGGGAPRGVPVAALQQPLLPLQTLRDGPSGFVPPPRASEGGLGPKQRMERKAKPSDPPQFRNLHDSFSSSRACAQRRCQSAAGVRRGAPHCPSCTVISVHSGVPGPFRQPECQIGHAGLSTMGLTGLQMPQQLPASTSASHAASPPMPAALPSEPLRGTEPRSQERWQACPAEPLRPRPQHRRKKSAFESQAPESSAESSDSGGTWSSISMLSSAFEPRGGARRQRSTGTTRAPLAPRGRRSSSSGRASA